MGGLVPFVVAFTSSCSKTFSSFLDSFEKSKSFEDGSSSESSIACVGRPHPRSSTATAAATLALAGDFLPSIMLTSVLMAFQSLIVLAPRTCFFGLPCSPFSPVISCSQANPHLTPPPALYGKHGPIMPPPIRKSSVRTGVGPIHDASIDAKIPA